VTCTLTTSMLPPRSTALRSMSDCAKTPTLRHERVEPMYRSVVGNERQSRTLAALRDTLLPKLIYGELRVQDAERFIGDVV